MSVDSYFAPGNVILFQGDSITDGARGRSLDPNHILGHGYAFIVAAKYGERLAERGLTFLNRGISGHKVTDLQARWQTDTIDLKPDILSILIGINDYNGGVSADAYAANYDALLATTRAALPTTRLVLGEPFGLKVGHLEQLWDTKHREALAVRRAIVADLAARYGAILVPYQATFDAALERAPAAYWMWDGIHPTYSGHQLMADTWLTAVASR